MASDEGTSLQLDLLSASLRADLADLDVFVEGLAVKLESAMPSLVEVERVRRGFRSPRRVTRITLDAGGGERLELRRQQQRIITLRARTSGGITLKTEALEIDRWLGDLARVLASEAARNDRTRQALQQLLLDS